MPECFVIRPFDPKFDKRFDDIYEPALQQAGFEAYRVDRDPAVDVPIAAIEEGIRNASICLADITMDNPNVWYELGYAYATGCPVILICSDERTQKRYPFDIQHRNITKYKTDSKRDFDLLGDKIKKRAVAIFKKGIRAKKIIENKQVVGQETLSEKEIRVLSIIAGQTILPENSVSIHDLQQAVE
ncbi:MAG: hypothetical protein F4Z69_03815, partial [Bacteroidetes bacterium SB0668_bin_1]|nr:hypothetical protein [Bacteroidetes bacterium SB0668_bin_1]